MTLSVHVIVALSTLAISCRLAAGNYCEATVPSTDLYEDAHFTKGKTLRHVEMMVRHGDRSPCNVLPFEDVEWNECDLKEGYTIHGVESIIERVSEEDSDSPWINVGDGGNPWRGNCDIGDLTRKGSKQHIRLGGIIGQRYGTNLDLRVVSSASLRAQQSALSFLSGLFGSDDDRQSWFRKSKEKGAAVKIRVDKASNNVVVAQSGRCPRLGEVIQDMLAAGPWQQHLVDHAEAKARIDYVCQTGGMQSWSESFSHFYENFASRRCQNKPFPCKQDGSNTCVSIEDANEVSEAGEWETQFRYSPIGGFHEVAEKVRLEGGPLLTTIANNLMKAAKEKPSSKLSMTLFSGHDEGIASLLGLFGVQNISWPPYISQLIIELWEDNSSKKLHIRLIHQGLPLEVVPCDYASHCHFDKFVQWYNASNFPQDLAKECTPKKSGFVSTY